MVARTDALFAAAVARGTIPVFTSELKPPLRAVYWKTQHLAQPIIFLSKDLQHDIPLLRCVLAEEIGHHVTGSAGPRRQEYAGDPRLLSHELLAAEWAYQELMPREEVQRLLHPGRRRYAFHWNSYRLAEYFGVTPEFARARVLDMSARDGVPWGDIEAWLAAEEMEPFPARSGGRLAMTV